jgi:RTX calcium-binding nonapeptide repeat (4 copies)
MALIVGNDSDNRLRGTSTSDTIRGINGNDILEGLGGADTLLGGKDDDQLFGGFGADVLSGDGNTSTTDQPDKGNDILVGGSGTDTLIAWGDDILVGGGSNQLNSQLITDLQNDPFSTLIAADGQRDTFIAINKDAISYTLTIADYEVGIDRIDLRGFGITSATNFQEIQDKGNWFEAVASEVNGAQLVLRINADPTSLTYIV